MSEIAQSFQWVFSTMSADNALAAAAVGGIWQGFADPGLSAPYALFSEQANNDALTMNAVRLMNRMLLQIKAVGPASSYSTLVTIADRIDALFKSVRSVSLSPGYVLSCYREQAIAYEEVVNGAQWSHLGGLYHIDLQGS
jgi:hypothetical protein